MFHDPSPFSHRQPTPPPVNYVLKFMGQPVFSARTWPEIHGYALANGFAVNAWGCLFVKAPGVTIQHPTRH